MDPKSHDLHPLFIAIGKLDSDDLAYLNDRKESVALNWELQRRVQYGAAYAVFQAMQKRGYQLTSEMLSKMQNQKQDDPDQVVIKM